MRRVLKKRGISPVIASVLLIALVLVLAAIIFLWARGFVSEQIEKFERPISDLCSAVVFDVARVDEVGTTDSIEIVNRGSVDIRHLDIKMFRGGDSEIVRFDFSVNAGESVREEVVLEMSDGGGMDKIIVYPALIGNVRGGGSNKIFTCMDSGVVI